MGSVQVDEWGQITCTCMNEASYEGFEPCHRNGQVDENLLSRHNEDDVFYLCGRCGNIISEDTYEIVGQLPPHEEAYDEMFAAALALQERAHHMAIRAKDEQPWNAEQMLGDLSSIERVMRALTRVACESEEIY